jgi:hypothetical protein
MKDCKGEYWRDMRIGDRLERKGREEEYSII